MSCYKSGCCSFLCHSSCSMHIMPSKSASNHWTTNNWTGLEFLCHSSCSMHIMPSKSVSNHWTTNNWTGLEFLCHSSCSTTSCHQRVSVITALLITALDWNRKICVHTLWYAVQSCFRVRSYSCLDFLKLEHSRSYIIHEARHLLNLVNLQRSDIVLKCNQR